MERKNKINIIKQNKEKKRLSSIVAEKLFNLFKLNKQKNLNSKNEEAILNYLKVSSYDFRWKYWMVDINLMYSVLKRTWELKTSKIGFMRILKKLEKKGEICQINKQDDIIFFETDRFKQKNIIKQYVK